MLVGVKQNFWDTQLNVVEAGGMRLDMYVYLGHSMFFFTRLTKQNAMVTFFGNKWPKSQYIALAQTVFLYLYNRC